MNQVNRLHPYYLVYIDQAGDVQITHADVKRLLDLVRSVCKNRNEPIPAAYQPFNERTQDGREMGPIRTCSIPPSTPCWPKRKIRR